MRAGHGPSFLRLVDECEAGRVNATDWRRLTPLHRFITQAGVQVHAPRWRLPCARCENPAGRKCARSGRGLSLTRSACESREREVANKEENHLRKSDWGSEIAGDCKGGGASLTVARRAALVILRRPLLSANRTTRAQVEAGGSKSPCREQTHLSPAPRLSPNNYLWKISPM